MIFHSYVNVYQSVAGWRIYHLQIIFPAINLDGFPSYVWSPEATKFVMVKNGSKKGDNSTTIITIITN